MAAPNEVLIWEQCYRPPRVITVKRDCGNVFYARLRFILRNNNFLLESYKLKPFPFVFLVRLLFIIRFPHFRLTFRPIYSV